MTGEFKGYLDRLRENLEVLDQQIGHAREMVKDKDSTALQWAKTLRDLVELRNVTLEKIKGHLLGRSESGTVNEPDDIWGDNAQVMYERFFHDFLRPWQRGWLKLTCEDCATKSEEVTARSDCKDVQLCDACYAKRKMQDSAEKETPQANLNQLSTPSEDETNPGLTETLTSIARNLQDLPPEQRLQWIQKLKAIGISDADLKSLDLEE